MFSRYSTADNHK